MTFELFKSLEILFLAREETGGNRSLLRAIGFLATRVARDSR